VGTALVDGEPTVAVIAQRVGRQQPGAVGEIARRAEPVLVEELVRAAPPLGEARREGGATARAVVEDATGSTNLGVSGVLVAMGHTRICRASGSEAMASPLALFLVEGCDRRDEIRRKVPLFFTEAKGHPLIWSEYQDAPYVPKGNLPPDLC
jgi:hypothetical protein